MEGHKLGWTARFGVAADGRERCGRKAKEGNTLKVEDMAAGEGAIVCEHVRPELEQWTYLRVIKLMGYTIGRGCMAVNSNDVPHCSRSHSTLNVNGMA